MDDGRGVRRQDQAAIRRARERLDGALDVGGGLRRDWAQARSPSEGAAASRGPQEVLDRASSCGLAIRAARARRGAISLSMRQPLADDARLVVQHAGEVAARPRQARDEARADRVGDVDEHDRDRAGLTLQGGGDRGVYARGSRRVAGRSARSRAPETGRAGRPRSDSRCGRCGPPTIRALRAPAEMPARRDFVSGSSSA